MPIAEASATPVPASTGSDTAAFYAQLTDALTTCARAAKLQPHPHFLSKCIQLYDLVVVRHGNMLVGPTGGGKSSMLRVTRDALTLLASKGVNGPKVAPVHIHALNPKAITMGQLYGECDLNTREWQDGVLAELVRQCTRVEGADLSWVVCDGPVDALWIESMNTVSISSLITERAAVVHSNIVVISLITTSPDTFYKNFF